MPLEYTQPQNWPCELPEGFISPRGPILNSSGVLPAALKASSSGSIPIVLSFPTFPDFTLSLHHPSHAYNRLWSSASSGSERRALSGQVQTPSCPEQSGVLVHRANRDPSTWTADCIFSPKTDSSFLRRMMFIHFSKRSIQIHHFILCFQKLPDE